MTDAGDEDHRPDLGSEERVLPRDIEPERHWIWRQSPRGAHGGWYRIVRTKWKPSNRHYYIQIDRPEALANLLANHFFLQPQRRVAVRRPITDNTDGGQGGAEPLIRQEG